MAEGLKFCAIVPAGGAGTRLWPLSRAGNPKFLLDLTGTGRTLLQATWDRLDPLVDGLVVVTGERHAEAVGAQLPGLAAEDLMVEPSPRDSMAAIGLAAAVLAHRHPDADLVVGSFAADHVITEQAAFADAVRTAVEAARRDLVVTIGIEADHPSTAFGYVETGDPVDDVPGAFAVRAFTEKPDAETAAAYLATGRFRWNAGMYVARAGVLLRHLQRYQPVMHEGLQRIAAAWDTPERAAVLAEVWPGLTRIAIDHAISEPLAAEGGIAVVPAVLGWSDVGDWRSLAELTPPGPDGVTRVLGDAALVRAPAGEGALVVPASGRTVVVLGVPDAVVVDTPDALLVSTRAHAQDVKRVVDALAAEERTDLL
ncbi:MAG TPA: mannose-1-phosphate guanylyltransferase [Actinotalea caeni]|uniref:mannose-1-phosphate guanylyltransferase n=1 Tax=Actinotalea caeni TaxID=1348467 RepID=UPI002B4B14E8|nr:mannose-1-phosphate guanylyltransferase [Actinotalea caeni]HLV56143.1 mannose-1-phosphate guanylyltransferase [Actinotalea caeni]